MDSRVVGGRQFSERGGMDDIVEQENGVIGRNQERESENRCGPLGVRGRDTYSQEHNMGWEVPIVIWGGRTFSSPHDGVSTQSC